MNKLPHWVLTNKSPAFYDSESGTAIEQTAKVYAKVNEIVESYNLFVDQINSQMQQFESEIGVKVACFQECIKESLENYLKTMDMKADNLNMKFEEAKEYMQESIVSTTTDLINAGLRDGSIVIGLNYDGESENLNITGTIVDGDPTTKIYYDTESETIYHY